MEVPFPYFDIIFDKIKEKNSDVLVAFEDFVHMGLWNTSDPHTFAGYKQAQERLTRLFFSHFPQCNSWRILDVGCGLGGGMSYLNTIAVNSDIYGITIDSRQLHHAKNRLTSQNGNRLYFQEMSANEMTFAEDSFDYIYALEGIFHFPSRDLFFAQVKKILKSGGTFGFTDFVPLFPWNYIFSTIEKISGLAASVYGPVDLSYSLHTYAGLCKKYCFTPISIIDITPQTIPTYDLLENNLYKLNNKDYKNYRKTNTVMKTISQLGLLQYKLFTLRNDK